MRNYISEDQIEKASIQVFEANLGFRHLNCYTVDPGDLRDGSGRTDKSQVYLPEIVAKKLREFNPALPEKAIQFAYDEITRGRLAMSDILANKEIYSLLKDGVRVEYEDERERTQQNRVHLMDSHDLRCKMAHLKPP